MSEAAASAEHLELTFKWNGQEFVLMVDATETMGGLKRKIQDHTTVQPKRQKLLGLKDKAGKSLMQTQDGHLVADIQLKPGQKIMLLGPPEEVIEASDKQAEVVPHIQDDFNDIDEDELKEAASKAGMTAFHEKIKQRLARVEIPTLNSPRPGKKCLVLDIDYCIFDLGSAAERPEELARPFLHEFLAAVYPEYDICIWSATGLRWIEVKMRELRVSNHPDFKITCFLDCRCMIPVKTEKRGMFDCKPLAFLWGKFPDFYNEDNTIMFDDLRRNFVYNKQNGLVIRPFKHAHRTRDTDRELLHLKLYLLKIASLSSFKNLRHSRWENHAKLEIQQLEQARQHQRSSGE